MCGIFCKIIHSDCKNAQPQDQKVLQKIKNRGPDFMQELKIKINDMGIEFFGAVLWMQGSKPTKQPVQNDRGILLYNGDIFDEQWDSIRSDTDQIMERFYVASENSAIDIIKEIQRLKGPYSLVYLNRLTNELIFTRDRIGRNSLLLHKDNQSIVISSVLGREYECIEVPATHVFKLDLVTNKLTLYTWDSPIQSQVLAFNDWMNSVKSIQGLPDEDFVFGISANWIVGEEDEEIQNFIKTAALESSNKELLIEKLLQNTLIKDTVTDIIRNLDRSIRIRLERQPNLCKMCLSKRTSCVHSAVGVLFSGGLDCTIIAFLADKYVPKAQSIDLMNVAFKKDCGTYDVPDRLTGRQSLQELKKMCPHRKWVFKEINVPRDVLCKYQDTIIGDLVYPRQTILDESLGSALWFAAKAEDAHSVSPCRVLLLGSGADELFGGYTRHRNAFKRFGWNGLSKELQLDWMRISFRNLARDNRVICDHGRQPRMPYLDEEFTKFVLNLKPWFKCFPIEYMGPGIGDKLFLRMAAFHLGLQNVALFPKRALQFGSRIANKKEKGSEVSKTFMNYK